MPSLYSVITSLFSAIFISLLKGYKAFLSPFLPPRCRFEPTCSVYALEAISLYGPLKGGALAFRRLCRCHPWGGAGFDPVPIPSSANGLDHE